MEAIRDLKNLKMLVLLVTLIDPLKDLKPLDQLLMVYGGRQGQSSGPLVHLLVDLS